jgi:AcrR family transcriptional regulator
MAKKTDWRNVREKRRRLGNREIILRAAEAVLQRRGIEAASMDDVAAEAQFSKATLYRYFRSKAELICEILIHYLEDINARLQSILGGTGRAQDKLREMLDYMIRFEAEKENITRLFLMDKAFVELLHAFVGERGRSGSEINRRFIQKIRAKRKAILESGVEFLQAAVASGEFRPLNPEAGAVFLASVVQGYFHEFFWNEPKPNIERDVESICTFILEGIKPLTVAQGGIK